MLRLFFSACLLTLGLGCDGNGTAISDELELVVAVPETVPRLSELDVRKCVSALVESLNATDIPKAEMEFAQIKSNRCLAFQALCEEFSDRFDVSYNASRQLVKAESESVYVCAVGIAYTDSIDNAKTILSNRITEWHDTRDNFLEDLVAKVRSCDSDSERLKSWLKGVYAISSFGSTNVRLQLAKEFESTLADDGIGPAGPFTGASANVGYLLEAWFGGILEYYCWLTIFAPNEFVSQSAESGHCMNELLCAGDLTLFLIDRNIERFERDEVEAREKVYAIPRGDPSNERAEALFWQMAFRRRLGTLKILSEHIAANK